ncbi:helix-turn-helix domain-containing protein [Gorillibacterium sp. sgz5001074]|uniref:helix-turn-helix domain-containing protein n=1 Tax=Gorillibacterium sp. sgz5001074 TaxID=3446695 RepID=UPI003F66CEF4
MKQLQFRVVVPHPQLVPYIGRMWVLEGEYGVDAHAHKLISPNGMIKLILIYKGQVRSELEGHSRLFPESSLAVVGQTLEPSVIDPLGPFGTIGIEFHPAGVYKLFPFALHELTNGFHFGDELFGSAVRELQDRIGEEPDVDSKLRAVQQFLLQRLQDSSRDHLLTEYAVDRIIRSQGTLRIEELCADTGYTRRHLGRLFQEHVGISPKELAAITRFQVFYRHLSTGRVLDMMELYDYYYDQSHFAKEFKRWTGMNPREFAMQQHLLGKVFHRE